MKLKGFFLFILLSCSGLGLAQQDRKHATDSLLSLLNKTPEEDLKRKSELLTHLCMVNDIYGRSLNKYVVPLYECALQAEDPIGLDYAVSYLLDYYIPTDSDSVAYYLDVAKHKIKGERGLSSYHYYRLQVRAYQEDKKNWNIETAGMDSLTHQYVSHKGKMSPYEQMEWNILIGDLLLTKGGTDIIQKKSVAYYKKALEISETLPFEYAYPYMNYAMGNLANVYLSEEEGEWANEAANILSKRLENLERYAQLHKDYPFMKFDRTRIACYGLLITLPQVIGTDKAKDLYALYTRLIGEMSAQEIEAFGVKDMYFIASSYYYLRQADYAHALKYIDSAIVNAEKNELATLLPERLLWKAQTLRQYGKSEEALDAYERYVQTKDSVFNLTSQKRLSEIETSYGVERIKAENAAMKLRTHKIGTIGGFVLFVLILLIFIYWFRNLRREKKMLKKEMKLQAEVLAAEEKALASEKMKASFIQSIVRELRTPLSAINSATELILDETLDAASKKELEPIVKTNTMHLNSLVDYMLEVSELDSGLAKGNEEMEPANVSDMCRMEVKRISEREVKPEVTYLLDLPSDEHCLVNLHKRYFSMMVYALISNAHKFTERGTITIGCKVSADWIEFSIADSGKGIPEDKQEWIFERFTKIDPYSSGTGLGLYLCRLITERVQGRIWLDTTYKRGAKFVFVMPCSKYY